MTDVKVTQADRDAAGALARFLGESEAHIGRIIAGELDHTDIVIAFARHRQAAEKAQQERDAGIADDYAAKAWGMTEEGHAAEQIATAIRSQGHE